MRLIDSRRITGPHPLLGLPGAIAEIAFDGDQDHDIIDRWRSALIPLLDRLGWDNKNITVRPFTDRSGATLGFSAPIDALYAATEINEWAISVASGTSAQSDSEAFDVIREAIDRERRPSLRALVDAAKQRGVPVLWDDDILSLGLGRRSQCWSIDRLPGVEGVPWGQVGSIPIVMVTGTNGKTTCTRWIASALVGGTQRVGSTTTDGICVDGVLVEAGDCTGPGAARGLLRMPIDVAVLETARGGLLRRGLVLPEIQTAVLTNVTDDHLGEYGVQTIAELAAAKAVVGHAVTRDGTVVLGADSREFRAIGGTFRARTDWCCDATRFDGWQAHWANGGVVWLATPEFELVRREGPSLKLVCRIPEIPLAHGGVSRHNVANALAVAAALESVGLEIGAIGDALRNFGRTVMDNPGRNEIHEVRGVTVLLDFAHNVDGIRAEAEFIRSVRDRHLGSTFAIAFGMPGDRSDEVLRRLAGELHRMDADLYFLYDQIDYLRGREPGAVPAILRAALLDLGVPSEAIVVTADERSSISAGLGRLRPASLLVVLAHTDRALDLKLF